MSSTPLDSFVPWTRQKAKALSKALSSIMHVGLIRTLTALKKPTAIWVTKISSIFQFWLSLHEGRSYVQRCMCVCTCTHRCLKMCTSVREFAGAIRKYVVGQQHWIYAQIISNQCKLGCLRVWVTVLMSSFHAVLRSLARWRCRFTILLVQICVFEF